MNRQMDPNIKRFLEALEERGARTNTIAAYGVDISQLRASLDNGGQLFSWAEVKRQDVEAFLLSLRQANYTDTSIARKTVAIRLFFAFLERTGVLHHTPVEGLRTPHVPPPPIKVLSNEEITRLTAQPGIITTEGLRDTLLLSLLLETGLNVSEMVALDVDCFNASPPKGPPTIRCRGRFRRRIPIRRQTAESLSNYVTTTRQRLVKTNKTKALFVNRRGERLTRQGVWFLIKGYAKAAGIGWVSPRILRRSCAARLLEGGTPKDSVAKLLGYSLSFKPRSTVASS